MKMTAETKRKKDAFIRRTVVCSALCLLSACTTYIIQENSENDDRVPSWTIPSKAHRVDSILKSQNNRYFVDTAQDTDKRLCLNAAKINATRKIAADVSQDIVRLFEKRDEAGNNLTDSVLQDKIRQNILVALEGVFVAGEYWEKRQYMKEKGAEKDYTVYKCDVVVKIGKEDLSSAIESYKAKTGKILSGKSKETLDDVIDSYVAGLKMKN